MPPAGRRCPARVQVRKEGKAKRRRVLRLQKSLRDNSRATNSDYSSKKSNINNAAQQVHTSCCRHDGGKGWGHCHTTRRVAGCSDTSARTVSHGSIGEKRPGQFHKPTPFGGETAGTVPLNDSIRQEKAGTVPNNTLTLRRLRLKRMYQLVSWSMNLRITQVSAVNVRTAIQAKRKNSKLINTNNQLSAIGYQEKKN